MNLVQGDVCLGRPADEYIERGEAVLRKRVNRDVRLCQEHDICDAAGSRKRMNMRHKDRGAGSLGSFLERRLDLGGVHQMLASVEVGQKV